MSYSKTTKLRNIRSGFCKTGLWYPVKRSASMNSLTHLPYFVFNLQPQPSARQNMEAFNPKRRSLLHDAYTKKVKDCYRQLHKRSTLDCIICFRSSSKAQEEAHKKLATNEQRLEHREF